MNKSTNEFEFTQREGEELTLQTAVFEALGAVSVCWELMGGDGVFDDTRAREIGEKLVAFVEGSLPVPVYEYGVKAPVSDKSYDIVPARSEQQARGMLEGTRRSKLMRRVPAGDWELVPVGVFDGE